jgi:hypothetical protein
MAGSAPVQPKKENGVEPPQSKRSAAAFRSIVREGQKKKRCENTALQNG